MIPDVLHIGPIPLHLFGICLAIAFLVAGRIAGSAGREKGRARESVLRGLADGSIDSLVGTHAIFQQKVAYRRLGLAVVDEQHRFGVAQRLALTRKGAVPDVLVYSLTWRL